MDAACTHTAAEVHACQDNDGEVVADLGSDEAAEARDHTEDDPWRHLLRRSALAVGRTLQAVAVDSTDRDGHRQLEAAEVGDSMLRQLLVEEDDRMVSREKGQRLPSTIRHCRFRILVVARRRNRIQHVTAA